MLINLVLNRYP